MITEPLTQIKSADKIVWMTKPAPNREVISEIADYTILSLIDTVLKRSDRKVGAEILMSTSELLGDRLYDEFVKQKFKTPKEWAEAVNKLIFAPMGTQAKFTRITPNEIESEIYTCPTIYRATAAPNITCPVSCGFARALWRKSFPQGEVTVGKTIAKGAEKCEFKFTTKSEKSFREHWKAEIGGAAVKLSRAEQKKPLTDFSIRVADYTVIALIDSIFQKLAKEDASELIISAAELLGKTVFEKRVEKKLERWTPMEWAKITSGYIWNLQGTGIVFSEISAEKIICHVFKCPTPERAGKAPHLTCPFSWGYARGVWKAAFPEGELLMGGTMAHGAPTCQFLWYVKAEKEHLEQREKVKKYLTREEEIRML